MCSLVHVVRVVIVRVILVGVRGVTVVHIGHDEVLVVVFFYVAIFVVIFCIWRCTLYKIKAEIPLQNENPLNHQILWQQYIERIESLSPESKVSRFCKEAGFMRLVEVGQYFVTKDTGDFRQFRSVACREYTLPRDDSASQPKGWIQGDMRIGLVLEVTTSFKNFKFGIEIRIWSVGQDNSQS